MQFYLFANNDINIHKKKKETIKVSANKHAQKQAIGNLILKTYLKRKNLINNKENINKEEILKKEKGKYNNVEIITDKNNPYIKGLQDNKYIKNVYIRKVTKVVDGNNSSSNFKK